MAFQRISLEDFRSRTGMDVPEETRKPEYVVSLREIKKVTNMSRMPKEYLRGILDTINLEGDPNTYPYRGLEFEIDTFGPGTVLRAQTFVEDEKLLGILKYLDSLMDERYQVRGFAQLGPYIFSGCDHDGVPVVAHYLPAIVERHPALSCSVLLDGTHRCTLVSKVGNGMTGIFIDGVEVPFPCTPIPARDIRFVKEKPPREERFLDLNVKYFRRLPWAGIDG